MNDNDAQKIADLVDERLNKALEPIKNDLSELKQDVGGLKQDVNGLKEDVGGLKQDLKEVKDIQESRILPSLTEIEVTVKSYADSYKINKHNIERVDTRLSTVEDKLNIEVPEDLKVPHFADQSH